MKLREELQRLAFAARSLREAERTKMDIKPPGHAVAAGN
jgi:hypothetical protein